MGSSTTTLQSVVDLIATMGELSPVLPTGGYSTSAALSMATDVMNDLISIRFNWKWNSIKLAPFYTNSWQADYAMIAMPTIGWLEHATVIDINNTSLPKPRTFPEVVRDLEWTNSAGSPPSQLCWHYNSRLEQGLWPGAKQLYTSPLGAIQIPTNPPTNILDANYNILVLTGYGTTGLSAPVLPLASAVGASVVDGTCMWTVADPSGQGFRISPLPPQSGVVYQINVIAQAASPIFTSMAQLLTPIPDDFASSFRDGFITYCHRGSPDPNIKKQFPMMHQMWLESLMTAARQGDREADSAGFYPDRGVMSPGDTGPVGPGNPYRTGW